MISNLNYNTRAVKTADTGMKIDIEDRIENPERNSPIYGQMISHKVKPSCQQMVWGKLDIYLKKMKLEPYLTPCTKNKKPSK